MIRRQNSRLPSSQSFDHMVYLRVFEGCNLHCQHCFIPSNPKRMTLEDIATIPTMIEGRIPHQSVVLMQWHGGEPTLMGSKFIKQAIDSIEQNQFYKWKHGIQTNLMTYDESWRDLYFDKFSGEVGVSWDPKIRLRKSKREDSHDSVKAEFETKLEGLIKDGLTPYLVVTAAKTLFESFPNPFDFFSYWIEKGVEHVHLERITQTGYARQNWHKVGLSNMEYSTFMSRWLKAYKSFKRAQPDARFFLSPFDALDESMKDMLSGKPKAQGCWSGSCDTRFHTIDAQGYKFGCTALTSEIGNKNAAPIISKTDAPFTERRSMRIFNCGECKFRSICKTGCLALDFDDGSGECSGGQKLFKTLETLA